MFRVSPRRLSRVLVPVLGLALVLPLATLRASEPAKATGTITGKVIAEDGSAAAGMTVRVMVAPTQRKKEKTAGPDAAPPAGGSEKPGKGGERRPGPVGETTTDDKGEFTVSVPAGEYIVAAGDRKAGVMGRSERVIVADGATVNVSVSLKAMPAGGGKGEGAPKKAK